MYKVDMYVLVRRACMVEGMSIREAVRRSIQRTQPSRPENSTRASLKSQQRSDYFTLSSGCEPSVPYSFAQLFVSPTTVVLFWIKF